MGNMTSGYFDIVGVYWEKYIKEQQPIPKKVDTIRPEILDSWRRSLKYGVSPFKVLNTTLPQENLDALMEKNRLLIAIAHEHMKKLYFYVKGTNFALALVTHDGYVIDLLADDELYIKKPTTAV